jgi:RES domain
MSAAGGPHPAVPLPPSPLECHIFTLPQGTLLHRIHDGKLGAAEFNPGFGASRFAPFEIAGTKVPTAYAAISLECAVFETIFHDVDAAAPFKSLRWSALEPLLYSTIETVRELRLASLFSADLMKWGLERAQLIDTPKSTYVQTRGWSPAIHASAASPDGMVWTSRKFDQETALLLFGDRVTDVDLNPVTSVKVASDAVSLQVIVDLARRAGVVITR